MKASNDRDYLPTLSELLKLPVFHNAAILCEEGLDHPVGGIFLSEIPDYDNWVRPGELVVTNCYALYEHPELLAEFIPRLSELGAAGVCIKSDRFLGGSVPEFMIASAQELRFPLIELPGGIHFTDITKEVTDELLRRKTEVLEASLAVGELLVRTITEGASLDEIAQMVREITCRNVLILDAVNHRQSAAFREDEKENYPMPESTEFFHKILQNSDRYEMETAGNSFGTLFLFGNKEGAAIKPELMEQILLAIPLEISRFHLAHENDERSFHEFFCMTGMPSVCGESPQGA